MISLKDILETPRFSDLKLLTNSKVLDDRMIESVEITETPDVEKYIPQNVLILSTGMIFKDNQENLIPFIQSLVRAKAIGLGIKVGRFLNEIDPKVISYANKINFPLLLIPDHFPLGSLLHQIMNLVLKTEREEIDFALDIQKSFSNLLVQDASNDLLVREFSRMIKTPTILLDPFGQIISSSHHFKNHKDQAEHYVESLFHERKKTKRHNGSFIISDFEGEKRHLSLIEIRVHTYYPHYLIIVDPEQVPFPTSIFAIEQAALVFQFNLYKNQKINEALYANEAHFFSDLIDQQLQDSFSESNWYKMIHNYGYIQTDFYQIIHISSKEIIKEQNNVPSLRTNEKLYLSYSWLRKNIRHYFKNAIVIWRAEVQEIVLILQEQSPNLEQNLLTISNKINALINSHLIFNVGYSVSRSELIKQSYAQAKIAHNGRQNKETQDTVIFYRDKGMYQLFNNLDQNELVYYCKSILKDLAYPEEESMLDLRNTLDAYLKNQSEITQTANNLFIHRNTVKYRINRCEEILGVKVDAPEESLNIRLALELSKQK